MVYKQEVINLLAKVYNFDVLQTGNPKTLVFGNKTKSFIKNRTKTLINLMFEEYKVKYVFIACNTASTCLNNKNTNVKTMQFEKGKLYLATSLTKKNLKGYNVIEDETLAQDIENNISNRTKLNAIIKNHVKKLKLNKQREIILGCTHYELVDYLFKKYCPKTQILNNSSFIIDNTKLNAKLNDLNIVIKMSQESERLKELILTLIIKD